MSDTTNLELVDDSGIIESNTEVETVQDDNTDDQLDTQPEEGDDENPLGDDDDEYEEVERGDKRYKVPKALKDELMMEADYRRKTQVHAEEVRRFEERAKAFEAASEEHLAAAIEVKSIKDRLDSITSLTDADWAQLQAMDRQDGGDRYNRIMRELTTLPTKLSEAENASKAKREAVIKEQSEIQTKQFEQGQAILARDIPGWGPELGAKLTDFVSKEFGVTEEKHGSAFLDPALVKLAYAAFKAKETERKAAVAQKAKVATQNPPPKTASRAAPVSGLNDKLSAEEWIRRRNEQASKPR